MITFLACPKAFRGHFDIIQRNAIASWKELAPAPEVILFGDDYGTAEAARDLGVQHAAALDRNRHGTPLLSSLMSIASRTAQGDLFCYINCDMILLDDFSLACESLRRMNKPFLMSGGRTGIEIEELVNVSVPGWKTELDAVARRNGAFSFFGNDYFLFTRGTCENPPPMALGRPYFESWFFKDARRRSAMIVDGSKSILAIHQNHDRSHLANGGEDFWTSPESEENFQMLDRQRSYFLLDATHELVDGRLKRVIGRKWRHEVNGKWLSAKGAVGRTLFSWRKARA